MIYFIQAGIRGAIKIGYSNNGVKERIAALQIASPEKLMLIGAMEGTQEDESDLHNKFEEYYIRGEWFKPDIKLISYIHKYAEDYERLNEDLIEDGIVLSQIVKDIEIKYINLALASTKENKRRAARLLGVSLRSLRYKMEKYELG